MLGRPPVPGTKDMSNQVEGVLESLMMESKIDLSHCLPSTLALEKEGEGYLRHPPPPLEMVEGELLQRPPPPLEMVEEEC